MSKNGNGELTRLSIKELIANKLLYSKVQTLFEQHKSYNFILRFLASKGYKMSKGSLTNLKNKMEESIKEDKPISEIADKRTKDSIDDVDDNKIIGFTGKQTPEKVKAQEEVAEVQPIKIYSDEQVLDAIISKGAKTLEESDYVDPNILMNALKLHAQYYGAKNRGLTAEGLKQYQLIMQSELAAVKEVLYRYVPKEKQEEALTEMDKRTNDLLKQIGVTKEGKELLKQINKAGLTL